MKKFILAVALVSPMDCLSEKNQLLDHLKQNPFVYDMGVKVIESKKSNPEITICCHGYGDSSRIINVINTYQVFSGTLLSFNFPDYNITANTDHNKSSFGTVNEILPLLYILKHCIYDLKLHSINLYGFSAGGGAIINALNALVNQVWDKQFEQIGIDAVDKKKILTAIEHGTIILDCPLKSVKEIIAFRGSNPALEIMAQRYTQNNMNPIDVISSLEGIKATIFLNFEKHDEVLSNSDDNVFVKRLSKANFGQTLVSTSSNTGHCGYHTALWENYRNFKK